MSELTIRTICPKCGRDIEAAFVGEYRELLRELLQRAGHQPGDKIYSEIMAKVSFPGE